MPADLPTILATSGGLKRGSRTDFEFAPLIIHAIELSGVNAPASPPVPRRHGRWRPALVERTVGRGRARAGIDVVHLNLFPMPSVEDVAGFLLDQDVIWVGGGSVANLLAIWRLHGLDRIFAEVWQAGVVLAGVSAGSLCWHVGGTTDSFGPDLRPVTNGLGLLPYSNGVHYDSEPQRRPLFQQLIADGVLPDGYARRRGRSPLPRDRLRRGRDRDQGQRRLPGSPGG